MSNVTNLNRFLLVACPCLQRILLQVCTFHDGCQQGIDQQIFNRKSISY